MSEEQKDNSTSWFVIILFWLLACAFQIAKILLPWVVGYFILKWLFNW